MNPPRPSALRIAALAAALAGLALAFAGCGPSSESPSPAPATNAAGTPAPGGGGGGGALTIGVAFETLQTESWVAAWDQLRAECNRRNIRMLEAVADGDANRQLEQVRNFVNRRVDGIVIVPKDSKTVIPMIKGANAAGIPVVLLNRPADPTEAPHTVVAPDNFAITKETVAYLIAQARKTAPRTKAMILVGDLGDINAVGRRDGFEAAVKEAGDAIEVVAPRAHRLEPGKGARRRPKRVPGPSRHRPDLQFQ